MFNKLSISYRASFSGLSRETWLLCVVMLINRASTMVAPFMSMYITQSLHRSIGDAGLIITLFGVGSVLGSAAAGFFIDRLGFRPVMLVSCFAGSILFVAFGLASSFSTLCLLTIALAFFAEAFRPANMTAISVYATPGNLTRSYSLNRLAQNIGWGIGFPLGGMLASFDYHLLFWVEGAAYIIIGIYTLVALPGGRLQKEKKVPAQASTSSASAMENAPIWKDRLTLGFLFPVTAYTACFVLMFKLAPVYWKEELRLDESRIGLLLGLNGVLIALFEMLLIRRWEGRKPGMYYIVGGSILTALAYIVFMIQGHLPGLHLAVMAILSIVLLTFGEMMAFPFINTLIMSRAGESNKGRYASAYAISWAVANVAGPGGGALLIQRFGYNALWLALVLTCCGCALAFRLLAVRRPGWWT